MTDIIDRLLHGTVMAIYPDGSKLTNGPSDLDREAADEIKRLRAIVSHVETWVSNPPGSYSMMALDGLFSQTREMIALKPAE